MTAGAILMNRKQVVVLARSVDSGRYFKNYAMDQEPFEASGVFFGDYSGLAAYGGRVYGVWTEKPAPAPETKTESEEKTEGAKKAKPKYRGTVVKVGTADFKDIRP